MYKNNSLPYAYINLLEDICPNDKQVTKGFKIHNTRVIVINETKSISTAFTRKLKI